MIKLKYLGSLVLAMLFCGNLIAQMLDQSNFVNNKNYYNDCAAILYKGKVLVNDYSPKGTCTLEEGMEGKLTISSVNLSDEGAIPLKRLGFKVGIKNDRTNTIWMFSEETIYEVELKDLLKKCERNDKIIFMTVDQKYALPHHEIKIMAGC